MDYPSLGQLSLVIKNDTDFKLHRLISKDMFIFAFIDHLKEYFKQINKEFKIMTPLFDPIFKEEQSTNISIDKIELGELNLTFNNSLGELSSLVYYSTSGLLETNLIYFEEYDDYDVSEYLLLLHEFSSTIVGESILYNEIKKD